jgi:hypothetical protein
MYVHLEELSGKKSNKIEINNFVFDSLIEGYLNGEIQKEIKIFNTLTYEFLEDDIKVYGDLIIKIADEDFKETMHYLESFTKINQIFKFINTGGNFLAYFDTEYGEVEIEGKVVIE